MLKLVFGLEKKKNNPITLSLSLSFTSNWIIGPLLWQGQHLRESGGCKDVKVAEEGGKDVGVAYQTYFPQIF